MKGELTGSENLVIDGQVEGTINLRENLLTIGSSANISAEILAKSVIVLGRHRGNITGTEKIEIRESGSVDGDLSAPRVAIAEGAHFRGSIDRLTSCPGCRERARRRRLERVPTRPPASRGAAVCRPPQRGRLRRRIVGVSWTGTGMFKRRPDRDDGATASLVSQVGPGTVVRSTVMPKFMAAVARRAAPVVVDLGAAVGSNVEYLNERLDCTIQVQDLFANVEAHARGRARDPDLGPLALASHLLQPLESVDGILCWDLFDYLDVSTSRSLAACLTGLLRPGGALYGLFGTTPIERSHYTRFVLEADDRLRLRTYAATRTRREVLATREIHRMFGTLTVDEFVLLRSHSRETLFRKPEHRA